MKLTAYHGSPKKFDRFTEYRKRPSEKYQFHFGFHFAIHFHDALRYGRFVAVCDIEYWKPFDMEATAPPDKLPEGHMEVVQEVMTRSRNRNMLQWAMREGMIYTGIIGRASNRLVQEVLLKHGFDLVSYTADEFVEVSPQHKISVRYPAVIAMHASQISIRYWDEMTKWEWEERMAEEEQEELEELLPEEE